MDPDTGEACLFSSFQLPAQTEGGDVYTYFLSNRYLYSEDFSKISAQRYLADSGDYHVGWFDTQGSFVTEALDLQCKSDFDDTIRYAERGFSNGYFGFGRNMTVDNVYKFAEYYVPVGDPVPEAIQEGAVQEAGYPYNEKGGLLMEGSISPSERHHSENVTSWIDGHRAIVNTDIDMTGKIHNSVIVDTEAGTETQYIPGDSRDNSYGVASPDGTQIAFMSRLKNSAGETDIYITSVDGGDPVKLDTSGCPFDINSEYCILIDWR